MHFATSVPFWNSLDSVRRVHSDLEAAALVFFALLVLFDVLAHLSEDPERERHLERIGLAFFAVAVFAELLAYPYGQRNDDLSAQKIGSLDTETGNALKDASAAQTLAQSASDIAGPAKTTAEQAEKEADAAVSSAERAQGYAKVAGRESRIAEREADAATGDAKQAQSEATVAQQDAVLASNAAMRERFEREQLEELSAPRRINRFREDEYCSRLRKYSGTKFFTVSLTDTEVVRTARMIERLLSRCGWIGEASIRYPDADEEKIPDGVWIEGNFPVMSNPLRPAMDDLQEILNDSEIRAMRGYLNPSLPPAKLPPNTVRIVVGLRPDPYASKQNEREFECQRPSPPRPTAPNFPQK